MCRGAAVRRDIGAAFAGSLPGLFIAVADHGRVALELGSYAWADADIAPEVGFVESPGLGRAARLDAVKHGKASRLAQEAGNGIGDFWRLGGRAGWGGSG
jgi:hypothetical protein